MLDLLTIVLEAHNDERNHHRRYELSVGRDLLDDWTVTVAYGRVGQRLRRVQSGSASACAMQALVAERLRRRLGARGRIGCAYQVREFNTGPGFQTTDWIPAGLLSRLFTA